MIRSVRNDTHPMTLANMRENGVRSLAVTCGAARSSMVVGCATVLALFASTALAQDQTDAVKDCLTNVMTDFVKQKAAKITQDVKQRLSVENMLAVRRAEEQYCLRYVECQRPLLPKNELLPMMLGSLFSGCLKDEAVETYDLQEQK